MAKLWLSRGLASAQARHAAEESFHAMWAGAQRHTLNVFTSALHKAL